MNYRVIHRTEYMHQSAIADVPLHQCWLVVDAVGEDNSWWLASANRERAGTFASNMNLGLPLGYGDEFRTLHRSSL